MERYLTDVCEELHNFFTNRCDIHIAEYTIEDGTLSLPFLQNGQFFRIVGSVFNDGVYKYPATGLTDESFCGAVWAMKVPKAVTELIAEIEAFTAKQTADGMANGEFTSESFGGYSYTKATNADGVPLQWRDIFKSRLNRWRKLP